MFITKFNRLIRSKILWLIFAVVIVFSFVFWDMSTTGISQAEHQNTAGKLDGESISNKEFREAYAHAYFEALMRFGDRLQMTDSMREALEEMAWRRIATLKQAEKIKLTASDNEIINTIQNDPTFMDQGRFVPERYQAFTSQFLPQLGMSVQFYEQHVKQEIILNKLRFMIAQAVWVSPIDVDNSFSQLYDTFVFSYTAISTNTLDQPVEVTDDEALSFFLENKEKYTIPETMSVKYACFPASDYLPEIEIDDTEIADYYDSNIDDYTLTGTNGLSIPAPIEEVSDEIKNLLSMRAAMDAAYDAASEFEIALAPDRFQAAPSFEETAIKFNLSVTTTKVFTLYETLPDIDAGQEFNMAAFELVNRPDEYFSRPVSGQSNIYVLAYNTREDPRIPEFEEVREQAIIDATRAATAKALREKAEDISQTIEDALEEGKTFSDATESLGLEIITTDPFELSSDLEDESEAFYSLIEEVLSRNPGELTEPVVVSDEEILLGYLDSREPADRSVFKSMRADIVRYMKKRRDPLVFSEWETSLISDGRLEQQQAAHEQDEQDYDDDYEDQPDERKE